MRKILGDMLGISPDPVSLEPLEAFIADNRSLEPCLSGLKLLFGFLDDPNLPEEKKRQLVIQDAAVEIFGALNARDHGICMIFDDAHHYDKGSLSLLTSLAIAGVVSKA